MKSRISLCNKTVFWKDIVRFAPLWVLYMAIGLLTLMPDNEQGTVFIWSRNVSQNIGYMSIVNLVYGVLCALLLFGELFDARLSRTLHATPVRRETRFLSHVLAGMCFSLIPNLMFMLTVMSASTRVFSTILPVISGNLPRRSISMEWLSVPPLMTS